MVTILDITEDCTREVFAYFSLNEMIQLRRVCPAWNNLIIQICSKKKTLYLFFNQSAVSNYLNDNILGYNHECRQITSQNTLVIAKQSKYFAICPLGLNRNGSSFCELTNNLKTGFRFLTRLFVNVRNLIYEVKQNLMNEMNFLLWKWSTNLELLVLYTPTEPKPHPETFWIFDDILTDFWSCFEQMSSLRQFHFLNSNINNFELPDNNQILETIEKLEEFTFDFKLEIYLGVITRKCDLAPYYAQLKNCKHLRVGQCNEVDFTQINDQQTAKLTHLSIYLYTITHTDRFKSGNLVTSVTQNLISGKCDQFRNLTYLEVLDKSYNYTYRTPFLTQIHQLIQALHKMKTLVVKLSLLIEEFENFLHSKYRNTESEFPIFHNKISELHIIDNTEISLEPFNKRRSSTFLEFGECQLLGKTFPGLNKICIFSNQIDKTTFDEQFRHLMSEAFGTQVEVEFNRL